MSSINATKAVAVIALLSVAAFGSVFLIGQFMAPTQSHDTVKLTLLANAGVMIEADGERIYIDPIELPSNYSSLPADAVLITHPHEDHYNSTIIDMLQKADTVNIMPANMTAEVAAHNAVGVVPGDSIMVGDINITAFYMYTYMPPGYEDIIPSHPKEANWTSYIIDINGFTIFHAGDSKNITEYTQLTGKIDVALLPLGPGCQAMAGDEVVDAIAKLQPRYFIPIHATNFAAKNFVMMYDDNIAAVSDCYPFWLDHFTSYTFDV
jgi:L-ascorbate metabolism protein UlaG (beta-lactamase superfamily)